MKAKPSKKKSVKKPRKQPNPDQLIPQVIGLQDDEGRARFLETNQDLVRADVVAWLTEVVRKQARVDTKETLAIAEFTVSLAEKLGDKEAIAQGIRAKANALYISGNNEAAIAQHDRAIAIFREIGNRNELARTLSSQIQPLLLLGRYDRAHAAADEARSIFAADNNEWRLARVELNAGNIYYRQDRFREALDCYERAYEFLAKRKDEDSEAVAVALHNMAVCLISVNDFHQALATYEKAREFSKTHEMPLLAGQADYNIAWLYYLRGEYSEAIERLRNTREICRKSGDQYHFALCHLDLSEIYLELNLSTEAGETAQTGASLFEKQGLGYETAKCLANWAISLSQEGKSFQALEIFQRAREIFVKENNVVWPSLVDLYQALVLFNEGRYFEARRLCLAALAYFADSHLKGKAALCHLLLARLYDRTSEIPGAVVECDNAIGLLGQLDSPHLRYQAHLLKGQMETRQGHHDAAYASLQEARASLENLRSSLHGEELKIAFMKNKLEVYEGLISLSMGKSDWSGAFHFMEQAKSRSLLDLMYGFSQMSRPNVEGQSELVKHIGGLREELNWYYHRIEIEQLRPTDASPLRVEQLQQEARARETEFLKVLREMPTNQAEATGLVQPRSADVDEVQSALTEGIALIEYFRMGEQFLAAVISKRTLEVVPVTLVSRITSLLHLLQFQLGKFKLGEEYVKTFESSMRRSVNQHLSELYNELIAPIRHHIEGEHLVIVPHDLLHYVPFQALYDGQQYLIDSFTISHAPSASVFLACLKREANGKGSLILGVPDAAAPEIKGEVEQIASSLGKNAKLFLGEAATVDVLRNHGAESELIHIATHGYFRQDNPMFSGIKLGDSLLSLYDLYQIELPARLITLSGCATGLNVVAAGDELLGLTRGLLAGGASTLMLSLWDVHDQTTAVLMKVFYENFQAGGDVSKSLKKASLAVRESHPHPYHWAPFLLVGKP